MMKRKPIQQIIYYEYLKTALIPILIVELMLLIMYFTITGYVERQTKQTLLLEARQNIVEISNREVKTINQQMQEVTALAEILQRENQRFFEAPQSFGKPAVPPEFSVAANGVYYKTNDNGGSSVWYSSLTKIGTAETEKAVRTESMDSIYKAVTGANENIIGIYFNSNDSMCRYYPYLPDVFNVFDPKMRIPDLNFYYLADTAHNPSRKPVWTDAYLDPAGKGWLASCIVPIYSQGTLEGVTGMDITIDQLIQKVLDLKLPWSGSAFLVDQKGVILAMPEGIEKILGLNELRKQVYHATVKSDTLKPEEFNLLKNNNPEIAEQMKQIFQSKEPVNELHIRNSEYFLTQSVVSETGWRLMVLVDKNKVLEPIVELDRLTKKTGIVAFGLMILFYTVFFSYLVYKSRRIAVRIAAPIAEVARKTGDFAADIQNAQFQEMEGEIEEIQAFSENFAVMVTELQKLYNGLEDQVAQRTAGLSKMYEALQKSNQELENEVAERMRSESLLEQNRKELEQAYLKIKDANLQILQQEKMASIGQLAAGVAHEINNPMGFITSNVNQMQVYARKIIDYQKVLEADYEELKQSCSTEEALEKLDALYEKHIQIRKKVGMDFILSDVEDLLSDTLEGTNRIKAIVQDLRTFTRSEGQKHLADINQGIESVINIAWNELKYKIDLVKEYGDIPNTYCNIGQLNQVFMNVLINAAQAIENHGEIRIRTYLEGRDIVIAISDNGPGIPEDIIGKIFDPFFTTKEIGKGTGLGLSISYEIIQSYGGQMTVCSELGQGTTFTIRIPLEEKTEEI